MGEVYSWVKSIVIFLVLTTIITNLLGKSSYKKYINLITGIILVILIITPLLKLFQIEKTMDYYFTTNSLLAEAEDMKGNIAYQEKEQISTIFKEYKEQIANQVRNLLDSQDLRIKSIEVIVDEDEESKSFGSLKSISITAEYAINSEKEKSEYIEDITIHKIEIGEKDESESGQKKKYLSPTEINVKNLLSDFYNMNPDNINISIQE